MRLFVNKTAVRLFKIFLFLIIGLPVLVYLACFVLFKLGFEKGVFELSLNLNSYFFSPIHTIFGDKIMPVEEFGPIPGAIGLIFTFVFYIIVSYLLGNLIGFVVRKTNAS